MMRVVKRLLAGFIAGTLILSSVAIVVTSEDDVIVVNDDDGRGLAPRKTR